ncbi:permease-like cell division protein FtsX [Clostridium gasigenes]|uniref:Cell division protein FtsX n=1 Tax=Clostridium gasigenes TaxID=94869 RepID=A0A1H0QS19_9CLOT|nr:permease-like cell division protein FtsX [Clostridium gasigenes]MBB6625139.1 ABC transporter permease [Clostridium gasigenes]MBU3089104.1 permease-like cell division protein FtsX [Clostridium gasigenes]MBU3133849.1 permease-like cell division protein FtsX [Clostridium gasigenes]MBU3136935.1 permease-like cell division protein FtsX [Clostridium gasigenes]NKF06751.1 ABC transporter permease [Clostridium gasigenes]
MKINTTKYFISDALKSIKRNRTISIAAMVTVLITFFVFGTFILVALNFNNAIEDVASKVELKVYLNDEIKLVDQREIEIKLGEQPGVKEVIYESREEAFNNFQESLADNPGLLQGYTLKNNPLPSSFIVKLENPESATEISESVKEMVGVENVSNQQEVINTIAKVVDGFKILGMGLFILFIAVSIFLITNTIKLTVYSRRREVGIMKFVGATDWFIRWPFIIEGIIIGAIGSLASSGLLFFAYKFVVKAIVTNMFYVSLVPVTFVFSTLIWIFLAGGMVIGAIGSFAALRKFLVV